MFKFNTVFIILVIIMTAGCAGKTEYKEAQIIDFSIDKSILTSEKQYIATGEIRGSKRQVVFIDPPEGEKFLIISPVLKNDGYFDFSGSDCFIMLPGFDEERRYPLSTSFGGIFNLYPNGMTTTLKPGSRNFKIIFSIPYKQNKLPDQILFHYREKVYEIKPKMK